jgi:hypothetical protein
VADLKNRRVIIFKGLLFLMLGIFAGTWLIASIFSFRNLFLLGVTIWAFCRAYYFVFYVLEHYVDGRYKYRGLFDAAKHLWRRPKD